jgi:PAS domain S-box-containing protein
MPDQIFKSEFEQLIAPIARSVLDAVIVLDGGGVILEWNNLATDTFGWTREEAVGRSMGELIVPPAYRNAHFDGMRRYQRTGDARVVNRRIEISAIDRTGREFPVELAIVDMKITGQVVFLGFLRDISGRRAAEERLAQSEEALRQLNATLEARVEERTVDLRVAEEALRQAQKMEAVGQLTGGIAHDFNNLLQGVTGNLEVLQTRVAQGRINDLDRFITGAMGAANRASSLTHRLLAFSRRQPLEPRALHANPLIGSMEDLLRRTIGERIELKLVLDGGLWPTLCDPNQLESALLNLAINARDAMPNGGRLTIETMNAQPDNYTARQRNMRPGQYVCLCVSDTGTGMDKDTMAKAFDPFFTTKPIGQGTGLGLSMIYGFARQSEGCAAIYSELGKGTTIKLFLPRYTGEDSIAENTPECHPAIAHAEGETVLVVEDEDIVRELVVEVLRDIGYNAIEAADGPSGLEILQSKCRIDLLVTDIGLPGLNGRQVADGGRLLRPDLKVLFMTGYAENAVFGSGFLENGMAMITKPFATEDLVRRVSQVLKRS